MALQLKLLRVPRSSHYYKPVVNFGRTSSDSHVEDEMKDIYKDCPFYGVPRLTNALHNVGSRARKPENFNSDQSSRFTFAEFMEVLMRKGIRISMDGRVRCLDNAKMERFWWALKYEDIKTQGLRKFECPVARSPELREFL